MRLVPYLRLLARHGFRIHPFKFPMTGLVGACTALNSALSRLQWALYDRAIERTDLVAPPIFIIGHWRSGTTLLHELISLDRNLSYPSNFDAFVPHHMLCSRYFMEWLVDLLLPARRPMDNMALAARSPQEDDFALVSLGAPTPYAEIAFPNDRIGRHTTFDFDQVSAPDQERLREALQYFLKALTVRYRQRLVLKSPPHTARIGHLARWFPGAKFIHIARQPAALIASTQRMWHALHCTQGYQLPRYTSEALEAFVHRCHRELYDAYFRQLPELSREQLVEVQFERLLDEPESTLSSAFEQLQLPGIERLLPEVRAYFERHRHHRPATRVAADDLPVLNAAWQRYAAAFGYGPLEGESKGRPSLRQRAESTHRLPL